MSKKQFIFSVKKRAGYADKNAIVFEVMVRMPDYKDYPIAVGGDNPWIFENEIDAVSDCMERIADKLASGHDASLETFDYPAYRKSLS